MKITRGKILCAKKVVIYGPEGIGKSTFASQFPDPVFIDTEGSTNSMDVARLPKDALGGQYGCLYIDEINTANILHQPEQEAPEHLEARLILETLLRVIRFLIRQIKKCLH